MPAANIEINALASTGTDVPIGVLVQLSNADVGGELTYAWTILDQPEGSVAALSNPAIEAPTFTPLVEGTYQIRLVVNAGTGTEAIAYAAISVLQLRSNQRIPAAGETLQRSTTRGWATAVGRLLQLTDRTATDSNIVLAAAGAGVAVGAVVRIDAATRVLMSGLPGEVRVPEATLATATTTSAVAGQLGVVIGTCNGGGIAAGVAVKVRRVGLVETVEAGAAAVGDFVFASNLGLPALTAGTVPVIIGRVVYIDGFGQYRWVVEPAIRLDRRVTAPFEAQMLDGSGSWGLTGAGTATMYWLSVVGSATGLHYPLKVYAGETLYKLEADVVVGNVANLVTAQLVKGRGLGGGGSMSGLATSPAALGDQVWNITPAAPLALPQELPAGFAFWLYPQTNAGGNARAIGNVTAYVRPAA